MTVFDAFPNAIIQVKIAPIAYSSITGNDIDLENAETIDAIIDEGSSSDANPAPNTAGLYADTLIYTRPEQLPTIDTSSLVSDYAIVDSQDGTWEITDAGAGKNQDTGQIEHIELKIRQVGANNG